MNAIDIIKGMCQNGTTEQMGVITPINGDLEETIKVYFGEEYKHIISYSEFFSNVDYLYVYGDKLPNDKGVTQADFILCNNNDELIYLYEIENI